jgi:hypothetical protein
MNVARLQPVDSIIRPSYVKMSPQQWISVPDNPRQRDTERHLKGADHLWNPSPTHAHVSMAILMSGEAEWKLDGHTRALFWQRHPEQAPDQIFVTCYYVHSKEEASDLYTHFDNQKAAETAVDKVYGSFKESEFTPESSCLKRGRLLSALIITEYLYSGETWDSKEKRPTAIYKLVPKWLIGLKEFDSIHPNSHKFTSPYIAAALLTLRKHREKALEFWKLYNEDKGIKLENEIDPVEAVSRMQKRERTKGSSKDSRYLTQHLVSAFESWRLKRNYSTK